MHPDEQYDNSELPKSWNQWRSIEKDGLPPNDKLYIVFAPTADPHIPLKATAWFKPGSGWSLIISYWAERITHWMPMPPDPDGG